MWSAVACVPVVVFGCGEVIDREEWGVPSIVFVIVESDSPCWAVVWMKAVGRGVFGMVFGVVWFSVVVMCGVVVIWMRLAALPLMEVRLAFWSASWACRNAFSVVGMVFFSLDVCSCEVLTVVVRCLYGLIIVWMGGGWGTEYMKLVVESLGESIGGDVVW